MSRGAALDDAPWGGCTDGLGLGADHRKGRAISVWQTNRELSGTGAVGGLEWESATTGAYHQTGEFDVALLVGGSCPSYGTKHSGMAQQVFPPGHATRKEDRQGGDGAALGDCSVLDVAQGVGLRASEKVRFARGPARTRPWCAVQHRVIDWAARSPFSGEFEVVIMIAGATEEMHGSERG